jgi:hypothetical protein
MSARFRYPPLWPITSEEWWLLAISVGVLALALLGAIRVVVYRGRAIWFPGVVLPVSIVRIVNPYPGSTDSPAYHSLFGPVQEIAIQFAWLATAILAADLVIDRRRSLSLAMKAAVFLALPLAWGWSNLPGLSHSRGVDRMLRCKHQMKRIGLALHNSADQNDGWLRDRSPPAAGLPSRSWRVELLPYFDEQQLRSQYVDSVAWNAPENQKVAQSRVQGLYECPSNRYLHDADGRWFTDYLAITGRHAFFPTSGEGRHIRDVPDGLSWTALVVEACGQQVPWTEPRDLNVDETPIGVNLHGNSRGRSEGVLSSYHQTGSTVLTADGSAHWMSQNIDPEVLRAIMTVDGHEPDPERAFYGN